MNTSGSFSSSSSTTVAQPPPFTVSQWHELEHQALIFKYLKAGVPVPPDLLNPIRRSLQLISSRMFHHPNLGYCSYYGKKIDPEPGRCRRTDGKKWRCSKDAHADSKYCERHMNRSRYRSRKPVESPNASQQLLSAGSSSGSGGGGGGGGEGGGGGRSFQNPPRVDSVSNRESGLCFRNNVSRLQMESTPYWIANKEYRCVQGLKPEVDNDISPVASESVRGFMINSSVDGAWRLTTSQSPSNCLSDQRNTAFGQNSCSPMQMLQDFDPLTTDAAISKQQQHYFFGREFGSPRSAERNNQSLEPLTEELPKTIDFGYYLDDQRANKDSLFTTQLSMSIPVASSEFFSRSAHSSKDASVEKFQS